MLMQPMENIGGHKSDIPLNKKIESRDKTDSSLEKRESGQVDNIKMSKAVNAIYDSSSYSLEFTTHENTNKTVINVVDQASGEVVRQIPPEEILSLQQKLGEYKGNFVNTKG